MKLPVLSWLIMGAQRNRLWQIYLTTSQCVITDLTTRKVGFFISRNLSEKLSWWQDHKAGRRVYGDKTRVQK